MARRVTSGQKASSVQPEEFKEGNRTGYRIEKEFEFHSLEDIDKALKRDFSSAKLSAKDLSLPYSTILEEGKELRGLLLRDESKPRRVVLYSDQTTAFERLVHKASSTVRVNQGEETAAWFRQDWRRTLPPSFFGESDLKVSKLAELLSEAVSAKMADDEKQKIQTMELPPAEVPVVPLPVAPLADVGDEDEESEAEVQEISPEQWQLQKPSDRQQQGKKGKNGKRAHAKAAKRDQKEKPRPGFAAGCKQAAKKIKAEQGHQPSRSGAAADDTSSRPSGSAATDKSPESAWAKYSAQLDLSKCVNGDPLGHLLTNAQRALGPLQRNQPASEEVALLSNHIQLFKKAQKAQPPFLGRLSQSERREILEELANAEVAFLPASQLAIVTCAIKDTECVASLLNIMEPASGDKAKKTFNPVKPLLQESSLSETDQVKAIARVVIEWLTSRLNQGEKKKATVLEYAAKLQEQFTSKRLSTMSPLLAAAFLDARTGAQALQALGEDRFDDMYRQAFEEVMKAKQGPLLVLRNVSALGPLQPHSV